MLLLVTIGLVLIGTVSLVIGFVRNSLGPIYVSILCSVVAGVVLVLFSRMSRRQAATAAAGAGEPAVELPEAPALSVVGAAEPEVAEEEEATGAAEAARPGPETPLAGEPAFPITAYDELRVNEVVPLLAELDLDELDLVREHEERGKNRATLIKRIDDRIDELESAPAVPPPSPPVPAAVPASPEGAAGLPIAEYDELSVTEILPLLDELDDDELETVAEYEERTKNRQTIIKRIDAIFEEPMPEAPVAPEPAAAGAGRANPSPKKTPAKKTPAKKTPAKKAAAGAAAGKKVAAGKKAAPAEKAAAKKTAAKKTTKRA